MKRAGILLMVLFSGFLLFAQEPPAISGGITSDYRLDADGRIRQRIAWTRANAYFHEIEMEKLGPGAVWEPELKTRTEQNFLELSLPPGMYRYRILNYNVLGRVGAVSEWTGIRVFVAKRPAAESYQPAAYFVDSLAAEFTLVLRGRDLVEEAQVHIAAKTEGARPVPASSITYSHDEGSITAVFPAEGLALGAYDIVITNPGGIGQTLEGFTVGFERPLDINASLGYTPVFPLYGYFFDAYETPVYPLSFYGRAGAVPVKRLWGWIGFELSPRYTNLKTEGSTFTLTGHMVNVDAGVMLQKWIRNYSLAVNLRLGGGITAISKVQFLHRDGSQSESAGTVLFTVNAGASVQQHLGENFFAEAGLDYVQFVSSQSPAPGFIRISAGMGRKF
jgi:hypothetical protein